MKTLDGRKISIDQDTSSQEQNMQSAEETINYNIAHIMIKGTEEDIIPLDEVFLSVEEVNQHLEMLARKESINYIKDQAPRQVRRVNLYTICTQDPDLITLIHEQARISDLQEITEQYIHVMESEEEAFAVCIIPVRDSQKESDEEKSTIVILPFEGIDPDIREIVESLINEDDENE